MKSRDRLLVLLLAPLVLGGCLLPQPDTPPVPPYNRSSAHLPTGATPVLPQPDTPPITLRPTTPTAGVAPGSSTAGSTKVLPQPDTPPVTLTQPQAAAGVSGGNANSGALPPGSVAANNGTALNPPTTADANAQLPNHNPGMAPTPSTAVSAAPVATGVLAGGFTGALVTQVDVTDETASTTFQTQAVGTDGAFSFKLVPGRYKLLLTVKGRKQRISEVFIVESNVSHTYTIALRETPPGATISEDVGLADPAATAGPSP